MRFRTQQIGLAFTGLAIQGYLIWQWKTSEPRPIEDEFDGFSILGVSVGWIYVFVTLRGIAWALWSPERSRVAREQLGITEASVIHGPLRRVLQWFLHLDENGKDRDA